MRGLIDRGGDGTLWGIGRAIRPRVVGRGNGRSCGIRHIDRRVSVNVGISGSLGCVVVGTILLGFILSVGILVLATFLCLLGRLLAHLAWGLR